MDINRISILDCTLRDGGRGLEDCKKNGFCENGFSQKDYLEIAKKLTDAQIDIVELGVVSRDIKNREEYSLFESMEAISKCIPTNRKKGQLFSAMYSGADVGIDNVPVYRLGFCEVARVILRYSELEKSLEFCKGLAEKGYFVTIQPMLTMRYSDEELNLIASVANEINAYAVYIVDSYGYMMDKDIYRLANFFDCKLHENIKLGFHAHNHINMAFSNALDFAEFDTKRELILDTCILGMGQGAGNLQAELILGYLKYYQNCEKYQYCYVLDACEVVENYVQENIWGYSVTKMLSAIHRTGHNYSMNLKYGRGYSYANIDEILSFMPIELRHRYTNENLDVLIELFQKSKTTKLLE